MKEDRQHTLQEELWDFVLDYNRFLRHHVKKREGSVKIRIFREVAQLVAGNCFGERALLNNQRRAARIVTKDISFFGILDKIEY